MTRSDGRLLDALGRVARRLPPSRQKVRAGRALAVALVRVGEQPVRAVALSDGSTLLLDPRGRTEGGAFFDGEYEAGFVRFLGDCCEVFGTSLYDVGANVGLITIPLARRLSSLPGASVTAFEPVAANVARLRAAVDLNGVAGLVRIVDVALSDQAGDAEMIRDAEFGVGTGNAMLAAAYSGHGAPSTVRTARLDDLVGDLPAPSIVKLDVEGAEEFVLRGATETLRRHRPLIVGEFNAALMPRLGSDFLGVARLFDGLDYRYFRFADYGLDEVEPHVGLGDVVLCPAERVGDLPVGRISRLGTDGSDVT